MDDFYSIYNHGFLRAAASPIRIRLADPAANADEVVRAMAQAAEAGAGLIAFPELCLSGYAIDDLMQQEVVLDGVLEAVERVRSASAQSALVAVVGAPLRCGQALYNCAV